MPWPTSKPSPVRSGKREGAHSAGAQGSSGPRKGTFLLYTFGLCYKYLARNLLRGNTAGERRKTLHFILPFLAKLSGKDIHNLLLDNQLRNCHSSRLFSA